MYICIDIYIYIYVYIYIYIQRQVEMAFLTGGPLLSGRVHSREAS